MITAFVALVATRATAYATIAAIVALLQHVNEDSLLRHPTIAVVKKHVTAKDVEIALTFKIITDYPLSLIYILGADQFMLLHQCISFLRHLDCFYRVDLTSEYDLVVSYDFQRWYAS